MKRRVGLLAGILMLRMVVGGWMTAECRTGEKIRLAGKIGRIDQKGSETVIRLGRWRIKTEAGLVDSRTEKMTVIGRCERGVIDFLLNRNWLVNARIQGVSVKTFAEKEKWWSASGLRDKLAGIFQRSLPEPEASLAAGIVLGNQVKLEKGFYQALLKTGTVHMVVVSGYNLAVVAESVFAVLIYVMARGPASVIVSGLMLGYAWLSGWGMPGVRAWLMMSLVLVARYKGRGGGGTGWWLWVTCWLMVMVEPELVENISFQLSVGATAGLVWVEPHLRRLVTSKQRLIEFVAQTELVPTLSAQALTVPLIWWHFGRISWIAPLVNVLVLPLTPPAMLLGVLLLGVGGISGGLLSWLVAPFLYSVLHLMVIIVNGFGQ